MAPNASVAPCDMELNEIKEPHENDVLCGRGGSINSWKGNERFRTLVEKRKRVYLTARFKREKRLIASSIVQDIQSLDPPGRFLSRNAKKGTWYVIDDDKARDKVSQALRENAPTIRAEIETEINEQRAEIHRGEQHPHHQAPPPPGGPHAPPPPPYYPQQQQQGWGYFSYYGYAQQAPPPGGANMPPPPQPQQLPHQGSGGPPPYPPQQPQQQQQQPPAYGGPTGQWHHTPGNMSPVSQQQQEQQAPEQQLSQSQQNQQQMRQTPPPPQQQYQMNFADYSQQPQQSQSQQQSQQYQPQLQEQQQYPSQMQQEQMQQDDQPQRDQQQHQQNGYNGSMQQPQDDDKSIFDATVEFVSAAFPSSLASWTKDAFSIDGFSIGGGMSVASNREDQQETASVASKPIKYVHQPSDSSVASRARSVTFKDERSISGRALDTKKLSNKPPRIMHSSQISYPRRPFQRKGSNTGQLPPTNPNQSVISNNGAMAPVSSVHLNNDSDNMISLMTTEGMNSIMEDGPFMMNDFDQSDNPAYNAEQQQKQDFLSMPPPGMVDHRRIKRQPKRTSSDLGNNNAPDEAAVANQSATGIESWDISTGGPEAMAAKKNAADTMAVEIEGQEVQLVDMMDTNSHNSSTAPGDSSVLEDRMPPHDRESLQVDWPSRVGSCHSFFNDSFAGASFFSLTNSRGDGISPAASMDMDVSSATDPYSGANSIGGGSLGGGSLCRVFDESSVATNTMQQQSALSPAAQNAQNRMLARMPSWERNKGNKSPLSVGSGDALDDDHCSFMTKSSEKLMGGSISLTSADNSSSAAANNEKYGVRAWEDHRKE